MIASDYYIGYQDGLPIIRSTLSDENGPINLTGATVTLYIHKVGTSTNRSIVGVITSAALGQVQYTFTAAISTPAGRWWAHQKADYGGGQVLTVPNQGADKVWVNPFYGAA